LDPEAEAITSLTFPPLPKRPITRYILSDWHCQAIVKIAVYINWAAPLLLFVLLCGCSDIPKPLEVHVPLPAHLIDADGTPVQGAPEPEVVQLESVETIQGTLHVTVGNAAGDYALVCDLDANKEVEIQSCLAPLPERNYLLFHKNSKWLIKGAQKPVNLEFMQGFSVKYNEGENIGLLPAKNLQGEGFRLFWLSSWTTKRTFR
jgi:hypothetical protein